MSSSGCQVQGRVAFAVLPDDQLAEVMGNEAGELLVSIIGSNVEECVLLWSQLGEDGGES